MKALSRMSFKELRLHLDTLTLSIRRATDEDWRELLSKLHMEVALELDRRQESERSDDYA